jgi:hypothetical protein
MAKTLLQWRNALALSVDAFHSGVTTAAGASNAQLVDTVTLKRYTEDDGLKGCLVYAEIDQIAPAVDIQEYRFLSAYASATNTITVSPPWSTVNPVIPGITNPFVLYRVPWMTKEEWNDCINRAIMSAWPEVYGLVDTTMTLYGGSVEYSLPTACMGVEIVTAIPKGGLEGWPRVPMVKYLDYMTEGEPGRNMTLHLLRHPTINDMTLQVLYRSQYPQLATDAETCYLDDGYMSYATRAEYYQFRADNSRGLVHEQGFLQLTNYYRNEAARVKLTLAQSLAGIPAGTGGSSGERS